MKANAFARRNEAVTPVIGSIIILGISVLGIAAIMLWGAPTLQRIQEENAKQAMLGEFQEIRRDSLVLSITDSSRIPRVTLDTGTFAIEEGTRIQVTANQDSANEDCDFHVYDWGGVQPDQVRFTAENCDNVKDEGTGGCSGTDTCLWVYRVTGSNTVEESYSLSKSGSIYTVTLDDGTEDVSEGDWLFTLADDNEENILAQAWLVSTQAITWELGGVSDQKLWFEGGAIFSSRDDSIFLEEAPALTEEAFGTSDFVLRVPTMTGDARAITGRTDPTLFLGLVGNHLRVTEDAVYSVRFDFEGAFAQAWCNTLTTRDNDLVDGSYQEHTSYPCDQSDITAHRSVQYTTTADLPSVPCTDCFPFEFIHARITASIQ